MKQVLHNQFKLMVSKYQKVLVSYFLINCFCQATFRVDKSYCFVITISTPLQRAKKAEDSDLKKK